MIWVELCCGSAAVTLRLLGGPRCRPPATYMGGKASFAGSILDHLGVRCAKPKQIVLCDAGPWGRFWQIIAAGHAGAVAAYLRAMNRRPEKGPALYHALVDAGQPDEPIAWAAVFVALQGSTAFGKPVTAHVDGGWRTSGYAHLSTSARDLGFTERLQPGLLALRMQRLAHLSWPSVKVLHGDARLVEAIADAAVFIDPPYRTTTGYQAALPRVDVEALAERWRKAGATVGVSEAEPLRWRGWHHAQPQGVDRAPRTFAKTTEWLTLSKPSEAPHQLGLNLGRRNVS